MRIKSPFFCFNPKAYFYGEELFNLAKKADKLAGKFSHLSIFMTAPFTDLALLASQTNHLIVTAQHMDGITSGRGMSAILPEALYEVGVRATFLNHAEHPMTFSELSKSIRRGKEVGIKTIVCADSLDEAKGIASLKPDILLCEPTELIGTGKTSDNEYIKKTNQAVRKYDKNILVLQAAGVSSAEDVYRMIQLGADGTGCTSGITESEDPEKTLEQMIVAIDQIYQERLV